MKRNWFYVVFLLIVLTGAAFLQIKYQALSNPGALIQVHQDGVEKPVLGGLSCELTGHTDTDLINIDPGRYYAYLCKNEKCRIRTWTPIFSLSNVCMEHDTPLQVISEILVCNDRSCSDHSVLSYIPRFTYKDENNVPREAGLDEPSDIVATRGQWIFFDKAKLRIVKAKFGCKLWPEYVDFEVTQKATIDSDEIMIYMHTDNAKLLVAETDYCVFQDNIEAGGHVVKASQQATSSSFLDKVGDYVNSVFSGWSFFSNGLIPDDVLAKDKDITDRYGAAFQTGRTMAFIDYYEVIDTRLFNDTDTGKLYYCEQTGLSATLYETFRITTADGTPRTILGARSNLPIEACSSSYCQAKYGSDWFLDADTGLCKHHTEANPQCISDIDCSVEETGCVHTWSGNYLTAARCVNGECVISNSQSVDCCPTPYDTCPSGQYCDMPTYTCKQAQAAVLPCPFPCCGAWDSYEEKSCQTSGYPSDYVCCNGVCKEKQCYISPTPEESDNPGGTGGIGFWGKLVDVLLLPHEILKSGLMSKLGDDFLGRTLSMAGSLLIQFVAIIFLVRFGWPALKVALLGKTQTAKDKLVKKIRRKR